MSNASRTATSACFRSGSDSSCLVAFEVDVLIGGMQARCVRYYDVLSRDNQVDPDVTAVAGLVMTGCELDEHAAADDRG